MDALDRLVLGILGGALLTYGFMKVGAMKKSDPFNKNMILAQLEVPDDEARTGGKLALFIGGVFLLGAVFM